VQELEALMLGAPLKAPSAPPAPLPSPVLVAPVAASPTPPAPLALGDGPLDYYQLAKARGISLKELRHEVEMQCIKRALIESHGNISEAARLLLMKRSRLSQIVNANAELKEVAHADE
jgi:DNA-binding NtrC family response regulator